MCTKKLYLRVNAALLSLRRALGTHQTPLNTEILSNGAAGTELSSIRVKCANLAVARSLHQVNYIEPREDRHVCSGVTCSHT